MRRTNIKDTVGGGFKTCLRVAASAKAGFGELSRAAERSVAIAALERRRLGPVHKRNHIKQTEKRGEK